MGRGLDARCFKLAQLIRSREAYIAQSKTLNRLSDFLFVAARWCNDQGETDVKWVPGANR